MDIGHWKSKYLYLNLLILYVVWFCGSLSRLYICVYMYDIIMVYLVDFSFCNKITCKDHVFVWLMAA